MRKIISIVLLSIIAIGIILSIAEIPFGKPKMKVGKYYIDKGVKDTGATNIITSVVVNYRGFDTLGEVTVLFIAAVGVGAVLVTAEKKQKERVTEKASLVLSTGCRFLFPLILLLGAYIFVNGHLTPGGGFQGGAVIASAFLLFYMGCRWKRINKIKAQALESLGGLVFIITGLLGLIIGNYFMMNFLPKGIPNQLFSAGIIPVIYIALGCKVGSELAGVIDNMIEESE
ncbi:MAG: Na(+)/H(+) antiporter subunit B [Candidatus Latescibacteria bacterium]|nr:Na(+)/H(+) antiporter subunit B [Candidatus Latescibacterota bacterium]